MMAYNFNEKNVSNDFYANQVDRIILTLSIEWNVLKVSYHNHT